MTDTRTILTPAQEREYYIRELDHAEAAEAKARARCEWLRLQIHRTIQAEATQVAMMRTVLGGSEQEASHE